MHWQGGLTYPSLRMRLRSPQRRQSCRGPRSMPYSRRLDQPSIRRSCLPTVRSPHAGGRGLRRSKTPGIPRTGIKLPTRALGLWTRLLPGSDFDGAETPSTIGVKIASQMRRFGRRRRSRWGFTRGLPLQFASVLRCFPQGFVDLELQGGFEAIRRRRTRAHGADSWPGGLFFNRNCW